MGTENGRVNKFDEHEKQVAASEKEKGKNKTIAEKIRKEFPQFTEDELKLMFPDVFK